MPTFGEVDGLVGVLDKDHQPVGDKKPVRFRWSVESGHWSVEVTTLTELELSGAGRGGAYYVAVYSDEGELMFSLPMVGRPKRFGTLTIGR